MLFLLVHALDRHSENQGEVTIQFMDRRKATTVRGRSATFYPALTLYEIFDVPGWNGWSRPDQGRLKPRKFTQEFLSHGTITVDDLRFKQAYIVDLIRDGLFDIFPFGVPTDHKRKGLYTGQVYYRIVGFPPNAEAKRAGRLYSYNSCAKSTAFTKEFLGTVRKTALNFANQSQTVNTRLEPHLHAFLSLAALEKRPKDDQVFVEWIKEHYRGMCQIS